MCIRDSTVLVCVEASDYRHQRRTAQGSGHVAAPKQDALFGQSIQVGRLDRFMIHKRIVRPGLIIRKNQHHIGFVLSQNKTALQKAAEQGGQNQFQAWFRNTNSEFQFYLQLIRIRATTLFRHQHFITRCRNHHWSKLSFFEFLFEFSRAIHFTMH